MEFASIWKALSEKEQGLAREMIEEIQIVMVEQDLGFEDLEEVLGLSSIYHDVASSQYSDQQVDVEEFVKNPYYLGAVGKNLFPKWLEDLKELFGSGHYFEATFS